MQAVNPYLPNYEYVPDGEPHVFDGRLYLFGSHDRFNGKKFCMNDYVCWSAPLEDPGNWRYEGVIYKKTQDPLNPDGKKSMYAPDAAKGPDGRYYLYYGLADQFRINVAVCDTPDGKYEYYGCVCYPDGTPWGEKKDDIMPFDPAVLVDEDGRIHLYAGQGPVNKIHAMLEGRRRRDTAYHAELCPDMKTMCELPKRLLPGILESEASGFKGHEFFEASSIRKFNGRYYFIYSSIQSHELVYAISDYPDRNFRYGGILHSNGDIGLHQPLPKNPMAVPDLNTKAYIGNNHGSIVEINGQYYIFGHRHTNGTMYSRQGVAEKIEMDENGRFHQAEMTSCGLNNGPLKGIGLYSASIACNLQSERGAVLSFPGTQTKKHPRLTQDGEDREDNPGQYIANLQNGAKAGFKYFDFESESPDQLSVLVRGKAAGALRVYDSEDGSSRVAEFILDINVSQWTVMTASFQGRGKKTPLFFRYEGIGALDFLAFAFSNSASEKEMRKALEEERCARNRIMDARMDKEQARKDVLRRNAYALDDRFVIRDGKKHPCAVICPGGGYSLVCSYIEGVPFAKALNQMGISAFIVYYRVRNKAKYPNAQDDLARAIREIHEKRDFYHLDMDGYAIFGSSAGGHLAGTMGTSSMGYKKYGLPKPGAIILSYPVISLEMEITHRDTRKNMIGKKASKEEERERSVYTNVDENYPPVFLWCGMADSLVPPKNTELMKEALQAHGIPFACHTYEGVEHGVGLGIGTEAEGWIEEAVDFWRKVTDPKTEE